MAYQVLARKWRPSQFDQLIGQQAVVTALTNALRDGRVAQAYLFSGIRGVGKTTAARLFAKALNCERGVGDGPCNDCPTCLEISAGADLDVLEIDAATYSKVEQVRELAESLKYGPTRDRYKVVVLDEVHRLSRQAFDALLKIIEEPPPRLVFIFATTEVDAVPATVLSRCQEYHFRRVPAPVVAAHLAELCQKEQIVASERALRLIARAGEGSVRDAVALLDQLATFGNHQIEDEAAERLVGGLGLADSAALLTAILAGDARRVSELAREVEAGGADPRQVYAQFLSYCRDALHLALGGDAASLDLPGDEARALGETARAAGYESLLRLLHQLLGSETAVRRSDAGALALELAWLRAAELPKLIAIEELLGGGDTPRLQSSERVRPAPAAAAPAKPAAPAPAAAKAAPPPPAVTPDQPAPAAPTDALERFHEELSARRPTLAAQLARARCELADGELRLVLPTGDPLVASQLARQSNRELLDAAVVAALGAGARWRLIEGAATEPDPASSPEQAAAVAAAAAARGRRAEEGRARAAEDPRVQSMLDIFGGSVTEVSEDAAADSEAEENG